MKLDIIKGVPGVQGKNVNIFKTNTPGLVKFQAGLSLTKKFYITHIEWEHKEGRSAGKAAVGAIGGGILAGPLGLIAGAALGGKKNEVSTAVLYLKDEQTEKEDHLYVRMKAKEYEALYSWLT
jgi:hypothetical protein